MRIVLISTAFLAVATLPLHAQRSADVRVSNSSLQVACVDGKASTQRKWDLPQREVTLSFTMRNRPRPGVENAQAGFAGITFTPEPGHEYEIEVRAEPQTYSTRVWPKGEWRPVVRDRTTNQIVSNDPKWTDQPMCGN